MLGLAQQVGSDPVRIGSLVCDDENFGRPGNRVDANAAKHLALGFPPLSPAGDISPFGAGATMTMRSTPAILAGTVFIRTDDG